MSQFHWQSELPHSAEDVFAWHERPGAFLRLAPPWDRLRLIEGDQGVEDGTRTVFEVSKWPLTIRWVARHRGRQAGRQFLDEQVQGPMKRWVHTHRFIPKDGGSILRDEVDYTLPGGVLGRWFGQAYARRVFQRMFLYRHAATRADLDRHALYGDGPRLHVAISGASGMVGRALTHFLTTGGHQVSRLVRREPGPNAIYWRPSEGRIDAPALEGVDAVVHLAGESIAERWTAEKKRRILDSRVKGTRLLAETLAGLERPPSVFVSASAVGFYGHREDEAVDEDQPRGEGFLADVCEQWEDAAAPAREAGIRVVHPRIGVVMSPSGGALTKLLPVFRWGLGGPVGSGRQGMSWIALDDLVGLLWHCIRTEALKGPVNAVSPQPVSNREFGRTLGRVLRRPAFLPAPGFAIRGLYGEMGQATVLEGCRVMPQAALASGFDFLYPDLEEALGVCLGARGLGAEVPPQ